MSFQKKIGCSGNNAKELSQQLENVSSQIQSIQEKLVDCCHKMKWETFEPEENEHVDDSIKRAENYLDRLKQNQDRIQTFGKNGLETLSQVNGIIDTLNNMLNICKQTEIKLK